MGQGAVDEVGSQHLLANIFQQGWIDQLILHRHKPEHQLQIVTSMPTPTHLLLAPTHLQLAPMHLLFAPTSLLLTPMSLLLTPTYLLLAPTYLLPTPTFLLRTPTLFLRSVRPASVIPSGTYPVSFLSLTCHPVATYSFHVFTPFMCFLLSCVSPTLSFTCLVFITRILSFQLV